MPGIIRPKREQDNHTHHHEAEPTHLTQPDPNGQPEHGRSRGSRETANARGLQGRGRELVGRLERRRPCSGWDQRTCHICQSAQRDQP